MTVRREPWPAGTPAWVELNVPDLGQAQEFYRRLLGWEYRTEGVSQGAVDHLTAVVGGERVAGLALAPAEQGGARPQWTTYLAVDDLPGACAGVAVNGGQVLTAPTDLADLGAFAVGVDPTGAVFGLWRSGQHTGAGRVREDGCVAWIELLTDDVDRAKHFYGEVFGWTFTDMGGEGFRYETFTVPGAGEPSGGVGDMDDVSGGAAPHPAWSTGFAVADCDAAAEVAEAAGGAVQRAPFDTEFGRFAVVSGPFGEVLTLMGPGQRPG